MWDAAFFVKQIKLLLLFHLLSEMHTDHSSLHSLHHTKDLEVILHLKCKVMAQEPVVRVCSSALFVGAESLLCTTHFIKCSVVPLLVDRVVWQIVSSFIFFFFSFCLFDSFIHPDSFVSISYWKLQTSKLLLKYDIKFCHLMFSSVSYSRYGLFMQSGSWGTVVLLFPLLKRVCAAYCNM